MLEVQKTLGLTNVAIAKELEISERQYYRYTSKENLPSERRIPVLRQALDRLLVNHDANQDVNHDVNQDIFKEVDVVLTNDHDESATSNQSSPNINKEIKNKDVPTCRYCGSIIRIDNKFYTIDCCSNCHKKGRDRTQVRNKAKTSKRTKKSTTSRPKISLDDPCASCPARDTKSARFVDGEGA